MSGGEVVHIGAALRCECGHRRSEHDFDVLEGSCGAEVPMGTGFYDGNVCRCLYFEQADADPETMSYVCWEGWHHECMAPGCTCWCHLSHTDGSAQ